MSAHLTFLNPRSCTAHDSSPKGLISSALFKISEVISRFRIGACCDRHISAIEKSGISDLLPEIVVAIGSVDLVLGELDR